MSTIGNTINKEHINARNAFFDSDEKDFFKKLLNDDEFRKLHYRLTKQKAEKLYSEAIKLIDRAEAGEFDETTMEEVEIHVGMLLSALEEFQLVKEREKDTRDFGAER